MDEARIQSLQAGADNAVQRATMAGATADAKAQAASATLALQQAKFEASQQQASAKEDDWTQVQGAQQVKLPDGTMGYPFVNKRGEVKIVPVGGAAEKVAAPGFLDKLGNLFSSSTPQAPTVEHWVRDASGRLVKQ